MKWLMVGKTVVPFGQGESQFVLINEMDKGFPVALKPDLRGLADAVKAAQMSVHDEEVRFIKNDLPSLIWVPKGDRAQGDTVLECARLEPSELRDLERMLRG